MAAAVFEAISSRRGCFGFAANGREALHVARPQIDGVRVLLGLRLGNLPRRDFRDGRTATSGKKSCREDGTSCASGPQQTTAHAVRIGIRPRSLNPCEEHDGGHERPPYHRPPTPPARPHAQELSSARGCPRAGMKAHAKAAILRLARRSPWRGRRPASTYGQGLTRRASCTSPPILTHCASPISSSAISSCAAHAFLASALLRSARSATATASCVWVSVVLLSGCLVARGVLARRERPAVWRTPGGRGRRGGRAPGHRALRVGSGHGGVHRDRHRCEAPRGRAAPRPQRPAVHERPLRPGLLDAAAHGSPSGAIVPREGHDEEIQAPTTVLDMS